MNQFPFSVLKKSKMCSPLFFVEVEHLDSMVIVIEREDETEKARKI